MIIAEISNCHFGDFAKAKELIRLAHLSGADLIKGQAFLAKDIISGSMPQKFYEACAFTPEQYVELIDYARSIGNDLFFSIFSSGFEAVASHQSWHKVAAIQTRNGQASVEKDQENYFVSVPTSMSAPLHRFKRASVMHVSEYMTSEPQLWHIQTLADYLGRPVGYSDHTTGTRACVFAQQLWGAHVIEKHFCLTANESFDGIVYRDTQHGLTPKQFERLARELSK